MLQQAVTLTLQERGGLWGGRMATLLERQLTHLESLEPSQLKLKELELLAHIIETTDKTARRTFGLDQPQAASSMQVGIVLHNVSHCDRWAGSAAASVVDVDVVPVEVGQGEAAAGGAAL